MFKTLLNIWRTKSLLKEAFDLFFEMMEEGEWMFMTTVKIFMREEPADQFREMLFAKDREINQREKEIRKKLVMYLSLNPQGDIPACLALMSIVKDAERIGDYSKNIFELVELFTEKIQDETMLDTTRSRIIELFKGAKDAFQASDEQEARRVMSEIKSVKEICDRKVIEVMEEGADTFHAVAKALLARYYKRVISHLYNIASSVVNPLPEIDFRHKGNNAGENH